MLTLDISSSSVSPLPGFVKRAREAARQYQPRRIHAIVKQEECAPQRQGRAQPIHERSSSEVPRHHGHQGERGDVDAVEHRSSGRRAPQAATNTNAGKKMPTVATTAPAPPAST